MTPLWQPTADDIAASHLERFRRRLGAADYGALHRLSIDDRDTFWREVWRASGVLGEMGTQRAEHLERMPGTRWFPDAKLSFAENLLARRDVAIALVYRDESGAGESMSFATLADRVAAIAQHLASLGLRPGDRVAAIAPNRIETVIMMLAVSALGGVFSSCSPDFGATAIVDRFAQIGPRFLLACNAYRYGGKRFACIDRLHEVVAQLPSVEALFLVRTDDGPDGPLPECDVIEFAQISAAPRPLEFLRQPFDAPLYVMFSSGTTGVPKCIVHGQGGTLIKHREEHLLHCDLRRDERLLFFTTCGWMMWNWLVSALANGTTVCLYDGSPFHPTADALWRYVAEEGVNHLGISPGYLSALAKAGYRPREQHDLSSLRSLLSTGSPLPAASHTWAFEAVAPVRLSSITGGTDIIGCFALGNPCTPVYAGEIQCLALGMDVAFVDDAGNALASGKGELVCRRSFPSVPLGFAGDTDGTRFHAAYFDRFPSWWHHGDFGEFTAHGGIVIHGRSDAVLNRGGVRIGTAEIYRQIEGIDEVAESIVVGRDRGGDIELLLFVRLTPGAMLDDAFCDRIRRAIRSGASPRHVPDHIHAVVDIPRTRSGKLVELAVRDMVNGKAVANVGALANPEALEYFRPYATASS